jgi:hypothetical protein
LLSSRDAVIACGYAHQILNQNGARILMNYIPDADGRFLTGSFFKYQIFGRTSLTPTSTLRQLCVAELPVLRRNRVNYRVGVLPPFHVSGLGVSAGQ